jgi:type II secretory pathway pseudopilin PulG
MKRKGRQSGFTLIEVLTGMLAAIVLALAAGVMFVYVYRCWAANRDSVETQRDAGFALALLSSRVHPACPTNLSVGSGWISISTTNGNTKFYQAGRNLLADLDTGDPGVPVVLITNRVDAFQVSNALGRVAVRLVLRSVAVGEATEISAILSARN